MGPKNDYLLDLCMILGLKVSVLPSFVAKIIGNNYCTDTSVQPAIVEVEEGYL